MAIYNGGLNIKNIDLLNSIYPVGSIYMTTSTSSPASLFGGTWEQLKDKFLLGAGNYYAVNTTGGESSHTLTTAEMPSHYHGYTKATGVGDTTLTIDQIPSHSHSIMNHGWDGGGDGLWYASRRSNSGTLKTKSTGGGQAHNHSLSTQSDNTSSTDGGSAHNNMPPYLAVYMWKRTA